MKNVIKWVHILVKSFNNLEAEKLVVYALNLKKQITADPDIPVAGSPVAMTAYDTQITDVNNILVTRKSGASKTLTIDEHLKVSTLLNSTTSIAHYVEFKANNLLPGNVEQITKIFNRLGFEAREHGIHSKHVFEIAGIAPGTVTIHSETAGVGAVYHLRWSADQKTWISLRSTHESTVIIEGLPSGKVYFQSAVSLPAGKGKHPVVHATEDHFLWSDPIAASIPVE